MISVRILAFILNLMHALETGRKATLVLMQSPRLALMPLRGLFKIQSFYDLSSSIARTLSGLVDSLVYRKFVIKVDGQHMYAVALPEGMIAYTEDYESHVARLFKSIINPETRVVDVGASLGYYTLLASRRAKKIFAFEPDPLRFRYLAKAIRINKWGNVKAYKLFVSDDDNSEERESTLDSIVGHADVVKIDVEGSELQVIKGMREILEDGTRLIIELHPRLVSEGEINEIEEILSREGYKFHIVTSEGIKKIKGLLRDRRRHYYISRD